MKTAVVLDGNSLMYRMFYATIKLSQYAMDNNLVPVNAVKLMLETCLKIRQSNYDYCLVAFDHGKKTFRHDIMTEYKQGRKEMPKELLMQIPLIKESLQLIGFNILSLEGIEADDIIGSFTKIMTDNKIHVDIYSSDKDMLQLVSNLSYVHLIKTGITNTIIYTINNFANLTAGLSPKQIPDYKGIVGDKSDNLSGVKGIGEKTGIDLIIKYHSLEDIYNNLDKLSFNLRNKFENYKQQALVCKSIATIKTTVLDGQLIDNFVMKNIDQPSISNFLKKYKINGLTKYL